MQLDNRASKTLQEQLELNSKTTNKQLRKRKIINKLKPNA